MYNSSPTNHLQIQFWSVFTLSFHVDTKTETQQQYWVIYYNRQFYINLYTVTNKVLIKLDSGLWPISPWATINSIKDDVGSVSLLVTNPPPPPPPPPPPQKAFRQVVKSGKECPWWQIYSHSAICIRNCSTSPHRWCVAII